MASELEIRRYDKDRLHELLKLKKLNDKAGVSVVGLDEAINRTTAIMLQDDVLVVEQMIANLQI